MPRLTRIVTRRGDRGWTALGGGRRVPKDAPRIEALGAVDELQSALGVARAAGLAPQLDACVAAVQQELFDLGADLCFREADRKRPLPRVSDRHVAALEARLAELQPVLPARPNFVLPGGAPGAAHLHLARAICRRAERRVGALQRRERTGPFVLPYLNRLSDLLFVMARWENRARGVAEPLWDSRRDAAAPAPKPPQPKV